MQEICGPATARIMPRQKRLIEQEVGLKRIYKKKRGSKGPSQRVFS